LLLFEWLVFYSNSHGPQVNFSTEIAVFGHWVPEWLVLGACLVLPMLRLLLWGRDLWRPPARVGLCAKCGYDLRATPDRCPECGTIPAKIELKPQH